MLLVNSRQVLNIFYVFTFHSITILRFTKIEEHIYCKNCAPDTFNIRSGFDTYRYISIHICIVAHLQKLLLLDWKKVL